MVQSLESDRDQETGRDPARRNLIRDRNIVEIDTDIKREEVHSQGEAVQTVRLKGTKRRKRRLNLRLIQSRNRKKHLWSRLKKQVSEINKNYLKL